MLSDSLSSTSRPQVNVVHTTLHIINTETQSIANRHCLGKQPSMVCHKTTTLPIPHTSCVTISINLMSKLISHAEAEPAPALTCQCRIQAASTPSQCCEALPRCNTKRSCLTTRLLHRSLASKKSCHATASRPATSQIPR